MERICRKNDAMIYIKHLFKAIVKPRETFNELQGYVGIKEGVIAWGLCMVLSMMVAFMSVKALGFEAFLMNFGVGNSVEVVSLLSWLGINFVILFCVSGIAAFFARKFGNGGDFKTTIGMLGYTKALVIVRGFVTSMFTLFVWWRTIAAVRLSLQGVPMASNFFVMYAIPVYIFTAIFGLWTLWIETYAISIANDIDSRKVLIVMFIAMSIVYFVTGGLLI
jgi:hypothetical protein